MYLLVGNYLKSPQCNILKKSLSILPIEIYRNKGNSGQILHNLSIKKFAKYIQFVVTLSWDFERPSKGILTHSCPD